MGSSATWHELFSSSTTVSVLMPEFVLLLGIIALIVVPNLGRGTFRLPLTTIRIPWFFGGQRYKTTSDPRLPAIISISTLMIATLLALVSQFKDGQRWILFFGEGDAMTVLLKVDGFARVFEILFFGALLLAAVATVSRMPARKHRDDLPLKALLDNRRQVDFHILLLMSGLGMAIVALAQDLFMLFLGLELASLATYVLVAFHKESKAGTEGGVKYFIVGAVASAVGLYGMSLLYIWHGNLQIASHVYTSGAISLSINGLDAAFANADSLAYIGLGMMLVGFGFKVSAVPFHFAAPDAYAGAASPVAGVLATASKAMGFIGLMRVLLVISMPEGDGSAAWLICLGILSVVTMTWGNLAALGSDNPKRMLAYSSVAHAGYMLAAITAVGAWRWGHISAPADAADWLVTAIIFHLVVLVTFKLGAFLVLALLELDGGASRSGSLSGLAKRDPIIAVSMFVFMLALAGVPPMAGFMSKFLLIAGVVKMAAGDASVSVAAGGGWSIADLHWVWWLAVAVFVNSALSLYYYLRIGVIMFFEEAESDRRRPLPRAWFLRLAIWGCALGAIGLGVAGDHLIQLCHSAAESLFSLT